MPTTQQVTDIVEKVKKRLSEAQRDGIFLRVSTEKLDDDWLYIYVEPSRPGIRASEHASFMAKVERELRNEGDDNVLLVPAPTD